MLKFPERKKKKYEVELVEAIKKYKWMRFGHIDFNALSFSRRTAYDYKLHESQAVKEAFEENRSKAVNYMLQKWIVSDNPTLQIAAMRIVASDEDRLRLNQYFAELNISQNKSFLPEDLTIKNENKNEANGNKTE